MDRTELELEQRVWQRVARQEAQPDLLGLMLEMEEAAAVYQRLMGQFSGARREKLNTLRQNAKSAAAALRGILLLSGETPPRQPVPLPQKETGLLARAARTSARMHQTLTALSQSGEYDAVYRLLAKREAETTCALLELLGGS